jgi:hypothetical protein
MDWLLAVMFGLAGPPTPGDYSYHPPPAVRKRTLFARNIATDTSRAAQLR